MEDTILLSILLNGFILLVFMEGKHPHPSMKPVNRNIHTSKIGIIVNKKRNGLKVLFRSNNCIFKNFDSVSFAK